VNPVDNIKIKISKHLKSHSILDILLTIKCYLTNNEENPWYIFQGTKRDSIILEIKQSLDYNNHKNINDSILAMVSIKPIELILIPKNRKISLLEYIDDLIEEYSENKIIIIDSARTNPFSEDILFNYIKKNNFNEEIVNIYNKRSESIQKILNFASLDHQHFKTSLEKSREIKILDYWKNIWGIGTSYNKNYSIIDNLML
jgi:hypothetical protein